MLNEQELKDLFTQQDEICISLFMPLYWRPDQREANRIRLKNLIKEAEKQLMAVSINSNQLLAPAVELLADSRLHQPSSSGLAIFLKQDFARHYFLSVTMPKLVVVGQRFHTKPLLPLLHHNEQFHILAISQNKVHLFTANRYHIKPIIIPELPESMAEALAQEEVEKQLQYHMGTRQTAVYHGHNLSAEKKGAIRRYFRQIDEAITAYLRNSDAPLILACVDYLFPLYQEVNSYPHLLDKHISGNPDETNTTALQQNSWQLIASRLEMEKKAAIQQYQTLSQTERTSTNLSNVLAAAHFGRIDTLFTSIGKQQWGQFDVASGETHLFDQATPHTVDLLDETAVYTLLNGGTVYAVDPQEMPDEALVTAVFRY